MAALLFIKGETMKGLTIRRFQTADADDVATLWSAALPSSQPWNDPREIIRRKRSLQDGLFFVGVVSAVVPAIQAYRTDVARTLAEG